MQPRGSEYREVKNDKWMSVERLIGLEGRDKETENTVLLKIKTEE